MKKIKNVCIWFLMLNKRLFKRVSFWLILCLIPLLVVGMTILAKEESGILRVTLCCDENDDMANGIINRLLNEESIMLFSRADSIDDAYEQVKTGQADAAWIFKDDLTERIDEYSSAGFFKKSFVTVVEKENNISLQLSHEKLFGAVFPDLSYSIYKNFVLTEVISYEKIDDGVLEEHYDPFEENNSILFSKNLDEESEKPSDYLTVPLRGVLSIVVVLCGMAAVMYHQKDEETGVYDWLAPRKHVIPKFATCYSACIDASIAMLIALAISGMFTGVVREILALVMFSFASTAFCMLFSAFTRRSAVTGQIIPFVMFAGLALSPIFFNFKSMKAFQVLLPTYHYLYAINDLGYLLIMGAYAVIGFVLCYYVERMIRRD